MAGGMRKFGEYLGLLEDSDRYDQYDEDVDLARTGTSPERARPAARTQHPEGSAHPGHSVQAATSAERAVARPAAVADLAERRRPTPAPQSVAELSKITTLHPRTYNEARTVGENFRDGTPVIMNLSEMDDSDAKRLVDFAAGLTFATRGTIERVTNKVFLLSPPNVTVAAEDKQRIVEGGFFNQS
ncbi:cell division protein SepF [uncultured Nocardioides sp.]|uniref:cell division protein SepF n=1 Tax=uncultured Nocardioides sp. TaxID=198441 RepID=UPI002627647E|nr:cell division protein SepF [uncultured Nocardioides sp.]